MLVGDLAGAPGVRVGNWNNFNQNNALLDASDSVIYEDGTLVGGSFSMSFTFTGGIGTGGNFGNRTGESTNDAQLFNGVADVFTSATAAFSNIPFAAYDLYVYMFDDGASRIGGFTVGSTTYYARGGAGMPNTSGTGYVLSTDTTIVNGVDASVTQGNYVKFSGLTGSDLLLTLFAADGSTTTERSKVAGFQIVQVPEPSRAVLLMIAFSAITARRGRVSV